jgi:ribose transport system permease protein
LLTTGGKVVIGLPVEAKYLANWSFLAVPGPAVVLVLLSAIVSILLGMTSFGRQVYAVGANREAARLSGVNVKSVSTATLVISGVISSIAGILITARIGAGSPAVGPEYLLPGFAAVFLGSTQVRPGRFNVPGTLIAVFMLATGVRGLRLVGADNWVSGVFYGIALIVAVAVSNLKSIK